MLKLKKDGAIAHARKHVAGHRWLPAPLRSQPVTDVVAVEAIQPVNADGEDAGAASAEQTVDGRRGGGSGGRGLDFLGPENFVETLVNEINLFSKYTF